MALIADGRFVADPWTRAGGQASPALRGRLILAPEQLARLDREALDEVGPGAVGVEVPGEAAARALDPFLHALGLIAVTFPHLADGRGFSLARQLRGRGFAGELRACGPLIPDQYPALRGCGFDTVEIPEPVAQRHPAARWAQARDAFEHGYQSGYRERTSIAELRHRGPVVDRAMGGAPGTAARDRPEPWIAWSAHW